MHILAILLGWIVGAALLVLLLIKGNKQSPDNDTNTQEIVPQKKKIIPFSDYYTYPSAPIMQPGFEDTYGSYSYAPYGDTPYGDTSYGNTLNEPYEYISPSYNNRGLHYPSQNALRSYRHTRNNERAMTATGAVIRMRSGTETGTGTKTGKMSLYARDLPQSSYMVPAVGPTSFPAQMPNRPSGGAPIRRALVIGIDYVGKPYQLYGCVSDAKNMHALIRDVYQFDEILVLTDHTNIKPTRDNMLKAFRWLVSSVQSGDSLAFHYSGHGDLQTSPYSRYKSTQVDDTIVPLDWEDSGQILDDDLFKYLVVPMQGRGCLTATFDCCHSGTGMDLKKNYQIAPGTSTIKRAPDDPRPSINADVVLYSACLDSQTADDINDDTGSYGTLTHSFLEILRGSNYTITHGNLIKELQRVINKTSSQRPQLSSEKELDLNASFSFVCGSHKRV